MGSTTTRTITETTDYDNALRLKRVKHQVDAMAEQIVSQMDYTIKNQMATKWMGKVGALNFLQKVDYSYNSVGFLTGINSGGFVTTNIRKPNNLSGVSDSKYIDMEKGSVQFFIQHVFGHELAHVSTFYSKRRDSLADKTRDDPSEAGYNFERQVLGGVQSQNDVRLGVGVYMNFIDYNAIQLKSTSPDAQNEERKKRGGAVSPRYF